MKLIKCKVCNRKFVPNGIRNHILNSAIGEVYKKYLNKNGLIPHQEYIEKYKEIYKIQKIKI